MLDRTQKLLDSVNDDEAVLISSYPNIFYYSGFTSADAYLLITHGRKYIITDSRYFIQAREQAADFELYDIAGGFENIFAKVGEKYIGYEENHLTVKQYRNLRKKASPQHELEEMQKNIDFPRRIKDAGEIKLIEAAEHIGDMAFSHILDFIRPSVTEREVALELEFFMKKQGASALSFTTIAASGARSAMPHGTATDKVIERGDFLTLDFGCVYEGYCSDMTRTVVIGEASERQKEIYDVVLKAQTEAINAIKPGLTCSYIDGIARKIISDAGYGKNFGHGLGHSVGVEIHEMPSLSPKCGDVIKEGHILTVEPGIYIDGFGGVRTEDLIAVENGAARNLTKSNKELIII